jgi:hypothetical protein
MPVRNFGRSIVRKAISTELGAVIVVPPDYKGEIKKYYGIGSLCR